MSAVVSASVFSASGGIQSGPAASPHFSNFIAFRTSAFVGGYVFTSNSAAAGCISGRVAGGGRFKSLLKWSAHCSHCFSSLEVTSFPSLSFTGFVCIDLFTPR
ncbi:unnamed protein product [Heterobilharzia americana]|nr:unnamed protein product [Heterobilharzia americana]